MMFAFYFCIYTAKIKKVTCRKNIKKGNPKMGYLMSLPGIKLMVFWWCQ